MKQLTVGLLLAATLSMAAPGGAHAADALLVTPDQMKWAPVDVIPGGQLAVVSGNPAKNEPFVLEVRWPEGSKIGPHWHTQTERITILSGTGAIGMGDSLDLQRGTPMPAGAYGEMPGKMHHWFVARTALVMLIEGDGPFDVNFVRPEDDPTKKAASKQ